MNIGISCYPTHGGSGVVATELGIELARKGHQVHIISYSVPFRLRQFYPNLFFHEVELYSYPLFRHPLFAVALINKMVEVAKASKLDILHAHYAIPHALSAYVARQMLKNRAPKVVTTLHGTDITLVGLDRSFYDVVRFSIQESDGVTAVSRFLRDQTVEQFRITRPIEVIYNFVDIRRFVPGKGKNRDLYARPSEKIITHVSNFRPVKRIGDVIHIFARIQEEIPAVLLLVGEGQDRNLAQDLVLELGLQYRVHFLGNQDYVEEILALSDLFLLPSEKESFGLVALEAMSCGCPVIASDAGGIPEVVKHGETGYLHPVGDVDAMAESAIRLLSNPELHRRFSENARRWVVERFAPEVHVPKYLKFYEKVLG
jgi:N-acetyl-alpha-D-glucosaminyl L-malate synthase BshA